MLEKIFTIGIGGFLGSSSRYLIAFFSTKFFSSGFPYGTLIANLLGCFLIGILLPLFEIRIKNETLKLLFITGFMGSLTTFSTFSFETISLLKSENYIKGIVYASVTFFLCLILTFIGYKISLKFNPS